MQRKAVTIDASSIARATFVAKRWKRDALETAHRLEGDVESSKRLAAQLCETCYYLRKGALAGQAITQQPCGVCNQLQTYASTATDVACMDCAKALGVCKKCGADIELRDRPLPKQTL